MTATTQDPDRFELLDLDCFTCGKPQNRCTCTSFDGNAQAEPEQPQPKYEEPPRARVVDEGVQPTSTPEQDPDANRPQRFRGVCRYCPRPRPVGYSVTCGDSDCQERAYRDSSVPNTPPPERPSRPRRERDRREERRQRRERLNRERVGQPPRYNVGDQVRYRSAAGRTANYEVVRSDVGRRGQYRVRLSRTLNNGRTLNFWVDEVRVLGPATPPAPAAESHDNSQPAEAQSESDAIQLPSLPANRRIRAGDMVAGAIEGGDGVITGHDGSGELTRQAILDLMRQTGLPQSIAPSSKSETHYAGKAVRSILRSRGYTTRRVRATDKPQWQAGYIAGDGDVGESIGDRVLKFTLDDSGTLSFVAEPGHEEYGRLVVAEYERTTTNLVYSNSAVKSWYEKKVLQQHFQAAAYGKCWFIPQRHVTQHADVQNALSQVWGRNWMIPLPVADSQQLRRGLASGFVKHVNDVARLINRERDDNGALVSVSEPRATTLIGKLTEISEQVGWYSELLGAEHVAGIADLAKDLLEQLQPFASDTARRGQLIWDELRRDGEVQ